MSEKAMLTRRPVLTGLFATVAVLAAGVGVDLWRPKRPAASGPYSDLVNLTGDPQSAKRVGQELQGRAKELCQENANGATQLRQDVVKTPFAAVLTKEAADDALLEVNGWVMPRALVAVCYMAATGRDLCAAA
ncbi:MAG TPA: hypothetical protein VGG10_17625 [Rhizomicrobium sp.]|jgi:hypothetical protein